jgi:hypothetical protein
MQRLHEVLGDGSQSNTVKLDEREVDRSEIERRQEDQSVRIVEKRPGEFATLQKLHG